MRGFNHLATGFVECYDKGAPSFTFRHHGSDDVRLRWIIPVYK